MLQAASREINLFETGRSTDASKKGFDEIKFGLWIQQA
jgi:hypothetical protein